MEGSEEKKKRLDGANDRPARTEGSGEMKKDESDARAAGRGGLKIFIEFGLLIAVLAGFNVYSYYSSGSKLFLVVAAICVLGLVGWTAFYFLYVRRQ